MYVCVCGGGCLCVIGFVCKCMLECVCFLCFFSRACRCQCVFLVVCAYVGGWVGILVCVFRGGVTVGV